MFCPGLQQRQDMFTNFSFTVPNPPLNREGGKRERGREFGVEGGK